MEAEQCIELKIISGKDITAFNFFQKLTLYVLVYIESEDPKRNLTEEQKQRQRTLTDRDVDGDGSNPGWNHNARFDLGWLSRDSRHEDLFLRFEFRHDGVILGDKLIGESRVPLADLIRDAAADAARFVSYEVRSGEGKPNGIFNFSYKVKGFGIGTHSSEILEGRISGYPVLAPEDCGCAPIPNPVQYPACQIGNTSCYPTVALPVVSPVYSAAVSPSPPPPPPVFPPSNGEYHCYYPPPPVAYPYPPPPPPPMAHAYPPYGPQAHPWPPGPYFERRW
ncbi:hypothetical protein VNO78_16697 [Psophocarpus tetragonolobus]|uniref:C2 domain-containing protein n=1 Tax=Psophocarpus tetragonolobus TaxID=3891 RepID=A0AAN9XKN1_PSOTE